MSATPFWVWTVLIYVLFIGMRFTQNQLVYLPKLWIMPGIFLILRYLIMEESPHLTFLINLMAVSVGFWGGFCSTLKTSLKVFKEKYFIEIPGTYRTLILLLFIFICKYILGYQKAIHSTKIELYLVLDSLLSDLITGYFLGQVASYTYKYRSLIKKLK